MRKRLLLRIGGVGIAVVWTTSFSSLLVVANANKCRGGCEATTVTTGECDIDVDVDVDRSEHESDSDATTNDDILPNNNILSKPKQQQTPYKQQHNHNHNNNNNIARNQQQQQRQQQQQGYDARLVPSDLPPIQFFDAFENKTISVPSLSSANREGEPVLLYQQQAVLHGSILQQGGVDGEDARFKTHGNASELVVLPGLLPRSIVDQMLTLLRGDEDPDIAGGTTTFGLDEDPDSVDGMPSQEFYLDNPGLRRGDSGKDVPGVFRENTKERAEIRTTLRKLTDPYAHTLLRHILRKWYGRDRCGREDRTCTVCHSLIRR